MKTPRSLFTPGVLSLGVAILGSAAALLGSSANAQTTIMASTTAFPSTSSSTSVTTTPAVVTIKGTVSGSPENVSFSGQAKLSASVVTDPDFGTTPIVVLSIDLSGVTGVGSSSGRKYVTSDGEIVRRRLAAADAVQLRFPFFPSGSSAMSARTGVASLNLSFDVNSLKLTGASGAIASP
jgi:cytoskeletal protein RodZ